MRRIIWIMVLVVGLGLSGCWNGKPLGGLTVTTQPMTQEERLAALDMAFRAALRVGLRVNQEKALVAFTYARDGLMALKAINKDKIPLSEIAAIARAQIAAAGDREVGMILGDMLFVAEPWLRRAAIERTGEESFLARGFVDRMVDNGLIALAEAMPKGPVAGLPAPPK